MNPARPLDEETVTPAQVIGRATHVGMLDGVNELRQRYSPTDHPGNLKAGKEEVTAILAAGRIPLKRADFNRIMAGAAMVRANAEIANAFTFGSHEVSVFWRSGDIPCKARIDYLKLHALVDLKTIRNIREIDFVRACRDRIASYRYDIQAELYLEGRARFPELVSAGLVYGDHDPAWLNLVAATPDFAFVFVFYQADDAPITWGCTLSPGNEILAQGRRSIEMARDRYRWYLEKFGTEAAWVLTERLAELDINELPSWFGR